MPWKKKLKSYRGKSDHYSFRNKLKKEKKLNDTFESILNTLTLEEIIALSDRIIVFFEGKVIAEFPSDTNPNIIGLAMAGEN